MSLGLWLRYMSLTKQRTFIPLGSRVDVLERASIVPKAGGLIGEYSRTEFADNDQHVENVSQAFLKELKRHRQTETEKTVRRRTKKKLNVPPGRRITVEDLTPASFPTSGPFTSSRAKQPRKNKENAKKHFLLVSVLESTWN
ncbi:hypothetical protein ILUMI_23519 [Ignelater luminosus]|uniref:Uncharacterized protein n=1 Tax=Ignelater luminosus TaxID=2038154 RepID=A0A8K0CF59_IGNLU|nr:hypothetical protein ILUMI_23519 [Ignelater luminosus]